MNDLVKLYLEYCATFCIPRFYKQPESSLWTVRLVRGRRCFTQTCECCFLTEKNKIRINGWRFQGHTQQFNSKMNIELSHTEKTFHIVVSQNPVTENIHTGQISCHQRAHNPGDVYQLATSIELYHMPNTILNFPRVNNSVNSHNNPLWSYPVCPLYLEKLEVTKACHLLKVKWQVQDLNPSSLAAESTYLCISVLINIEGARQMTDETQKGFYY